MLAFTLGYLGASVKGWEWFGFGVEWWWPWRHTQLGRRDSKPGPGKWPDPLSFRSGRVACDGALSALLGRLLCKSCLRLFPLNTAPVVHRVFSPVATAWGFSRGVEQPPERWDPPHATHGERIRIYAACVRSAGSACIAKGLWGLRMTPATPTSRRFLWVIALSTLQALAPPIRWSEWWEAVPWRVPGRDGRIAGARLPGHEYSGIRAPISTLSGIPLPRFFTRNRTWCSSGSVKVWKHTLLPIEGPQCADRGSEPVRGWWDDYQILTLYLPPGQDARNQARKARVSLTQL